ncbi:MAG: hypothetical protein RLZZ196_2336 [Bacteroidota bacterium]
MELTQSYRTAIEINQAMARVYNYMLLAIATSGLVSFWLAANPSVMALFFGPITKWITIFAPLVFVFLVPILINSGIGKNAALAVMLGFAAIMGLSLSAIMAAFTSLSIVSAFVGAAVLFGTMSFYGYFTRQSLDSWGKWLFVGLIAIIIASIINIFIGSSIAQTVISGIAIILFMALTAYDTQTIRETVSIANEDHRAEILGALNLYLNFINIFTSLLNIFGAKDE